MALSDSMFLVEITVEELRSYIKCKEFIVKCQFADVFSITLQESIVDREKTLTKPSHNKYSKRKSKSKSSRQSLLKPLANPKILSGQSILFAKDIESLVLNMKKYSIELSLWSKLFPQYKLASTSIRWSTNCIEYLSKGHTKDSAPVTARGEYNVFDEFTSRRMAVAKLNIKLSYLGDKIKTQIRALSEKPSDNFIYFGVDPKPSMLVNTVENQTDLEDKPITVLNTIQNEPAIVPLETGIIKTIYKGGVKKNKKPNRKKTKTSTENDIQSKDNTYVSKSESKHVMISNEVIKSYTVNSSIISLVKSEADLDRKKQIGVIKSKSCSSLNQDQLQILNYIFGNNTAPFGNQVYCVSYFTVENENKESPNSPKSPTASGKSSPDSDKSKPASDSKNTSVKSKSPSGKSSPGKNSNPEDDTTDDTPKDRLFYKFKLCDNECVTKKIDSGSCDLSLCSIDMPLPQALSEYIDVTKCEQVTCEHKKFRELPTPPDDRILLDLTNLKKECCDQTTENNEKVEKIEKVEGEMKATMKIGEDPCYCECECRFGFTKKTIYCKVCGGYESLGDELGDLRRYNMPFPCPIYHKVPEKSKSKPVSITGSDAKKSSKKSADRKSIESKEKIESKESTKKETLKGKKKKKENKFKFNYGYTGIPARIGHSRCALPCSGFIDPVPKSMGWLWNSEDIVGLKFRPSWKPGAVSKHVVKLLKIAKNPEEAFAKKKRKKDTGKPKRPLKRPLIVVHKKDGEYTVTMETMKSYNKPRTVNQVPYEDKPVSTYKIGRTDAENLQRRKKKEREKRRLERDQRAFIQSAFKNMCEDICLKTYQQALGLLPDAEVPDCSCYPAEPGPDRTDLDISCSCSEDSNLPESDTDSDEWMLEFTPPIAHFDPTYKSKKVTHIDSSSQYSYMDYRVKLLDRYGNPVPRFFKGPDGKEQCSDLGGFWSPEHKWLEINVDGYVAPDGRWAPNVFLGPNNENVDAELGKFQGMDGTWYVVGIDGYVDSHGKWQSYAKTKESPKNKRRRSNLVATKKGAGDKKDETLDIKKSEATWSCFGDASAKYLSEMGIMGHGHDRKLLLDTLNKLIAQGEDIKLPQPITFPRSHQRRERGKRHSFADERKCRHAKPSAKGVVAVDGYGNKTYFRFRDYKNKRPAQRVATLTDQGISVSSFHMPCFHSFISSEIMRKQQYDRLVALAKARGSKGKGNGHHENPYQHNRRYQDSKKHAYSTAPAKDTNQYKNIIV